MMMLQKLLSALQLPYIESEADVMIEDISYDSRKVRYGSLFVAIKGFHRDGHDHVAEALSRGAVALLVEHAVEADCPQIIVTDSRSALAELSYFFYGTSDRSFKLTGITGTNGKTTITHLLYQLAKAAGKKPALIGTLGIKTPYETMEGERTTPESADLAKHFRDFEEHGVQSAFMEVSSHAIALKRVHSLRFDAAIFTNLTQDHLDFHKGMDTYFRVKTELFTQLKFGAHSIVNIDDHYGRRIWEMLDLWKVSYSIRHPEADVHYSQLSVSLKGIQGLLHTPKGAVKVKAPLLGRFNAENIAATIAAWLHLYPESSLDLDHFPFEPIPGRMEMIPTRRGTAVIDYAHTPDAMEKALEAASRLEGRKRIITLFGCGGERDKQKRPLMGEIAERYSDKIFITNDNPRNEAPQVIAEDIISGIGDSGKITVELERETALKLAYTISEPGDILMVLGKGAETYMEIDGEKIPFNDKEIILKLEKQK